MSNLQAWNSDPNASGSRTWPNEEIEQSIDLRVDGIPNDETYKDEQYMQRIAEQVQKLVTTKENFKDDSLERELFTRQFTPREGPKVTLRSTCVHRSSNALRLPRETERKLQIWDPNPIPSESRIWPNEEFEQSVDLRADGIPNDETNKDEQYMQRIAEQVQKLVNTERILKEDSPRDNILSEKTAKKIHEAGNCGLHEVQQRTDKVQCQRCYSYIEAGFQVCPCAGKLDMSEEMLSSIRQNFKQLIADASMTFQKTRGAKHGVQPWQKKASLHWQRVYENVKALFSLSQR